MKKNLYKTPSVRVSGYQLEASFLTSTLTAGSTGEDLETGDEVNPW